MRLRLVSINNSVRPRPAAALCGATLLSVHCSGSPAAPSPPGSTTAIPSPRLTRTTFLAFGDSLTAGTTSPAVTRAMSAGLPQSYPFKLLELLAARYRDQALVVENAGLPGEAAADGVRRLPGVIAAQRPEAVILLHGVNDVTFLGLVGVIPVATYVLTMAQDARLGGADVIVCTLPPQRAGGFRAADPSVIAGYNQAMREVARIQNAMLVDFDREMDVTLIGADGVHPTEAGYERMAQLLFDTIRRYYQAP